MCLGNILRESLGVTMDLILSPICNSTSVLAKVHVSQKVEIAQMSINFDEQTKYDLSTQWDIIQPQKKKTNADTCYYINEP